MKKTILLLAFSLSTIAFSQNKIVTKNGQITFEASVPSFEEVKAKNIGVSCVFNPKNGEIASLALMKGFRFKVALMEEHFNESYVESDKYPKAVFKGKVENFDFSKAEKTAKEYIIRGKLELHGKTKDIAITAKIRTTAEGMELISNFSINADDFGIEIPKVVSTKVSKKVNVKLDFLLK